VSILSEEFSQSLLIPCFREVLYIDVVSDNCRGIFLFPGVERYSNKIMGTLRIVLCNDTGS
jgi:hypothetical protein